MKTASVTERETFKKRLYPGGPLLDEPLPTGKVTIRTGYCPDHNIRKQARRSNRFHGVNENGWIFWCAYGEHYFVNAPPEIIDDSST